MTRSPPRGHRVRARPIRFEPDIRVSIGVNQSIPSVSRTIGNFCSCSPAGDCAVTLDCTEGGVRCPETQIAGPTCKAPNAQTHCRCLCVQITCISGDCGRRTIWPAGDCAVVTDSNKLCSRPIDHQRIPASWYSCTSKTVGIQMISTNHAAVLVDGRVPEQAFSVIRLEYAERESTYMC